MERRCMMNITKAIASRITLEDDMTDIGGVSFAGETLADFIAEANLRYGYSISKYNIALHECGIQPISYSKVKAIATAIKKK
jgi:hypothetical protein